MLHKATLEFLSLLDANNNKEWFDANRKQYENAKKDFELFVSDMLVANTPNIPELEGRAAKNCIFRIFKDVRFSKDKIPYKNNFGAAFGKGEKKVHDAGYYLHLQPGGHSFVGGGIWMPDAPMLKAIRQEIDYNFADFQKIINKPTFVTTFGALDSSQALVRPPKGYEIDNPAIDYLRLKSYTVGCPIPDKQLLAADIQPHIAAIVREMKPFIDFLNQAIG